MKPLTLAFLLVLGAVASQPLNELPSFAWQEGVSAFGVPLLKITYPDGGPDDFAVLRSFNPVPLSPTERAESLDTCIYNGFLLNEKDALVTITGCAMSDNFQIQFSSRRLNRDMFSITNGITSGIDYQGKKLLAERTFDDGPEVRQLKSLNSDGYIANIKILYDNNFAAKFGSDVTNAIRRILAHAQHVLKWPSLTTKVIFNTNYGVEPIDEYLDASVPLDTYTPKYAKDSSIHSYMLFGTFNRSIDGDTLGKGYSGGACSSNVSHHALIMKYEDDNIVFARSLAHEFGHNLNMDHDNPLEDGTLRKDSKGNVCTGIGSIMDYAKGNKGNKSKWSTCCVEDFTAMVNKKPKCLKEIDPKNPPKEVPDQSLSIRECNMNKLNPGLNGYDIWNYNGFQCTVMCIEGICAPTSSGCNDLSKTACQNICGNGKCDADAAEPTPCDMTKFGYDGNKWICVPGAKTLATCSDGMCVPASSASKIGSYTNSCVKLCGQATCDNMVNRC